MGWRPPAETGGLAAHPGLSQHVCDPYLTQATVELEQSEEDEPVDPVALHRFGGGLEAQASAEPPGQRGRVHELHAGGVGQLEESYCQGRTMRVKFSMNLLKWILINRQSWPNLITQIQWISSLARQYIDMQ